MQIVISNSRMWSWVSLTIALTLCMTLNDVTVANQASLVGTVYCDTCFHGYFSQSSYFIAGALVVVECGGVRIQVSGGKPRFREEVKTDEKGEFWVKLPFEATKHASEIKKCSVKLINSSEPDCAVASTMIPSSIRLKIKTPEKHVFSAGFFIFQPLEQPKPCQRQSRNVMDEFSASTPSPSPVGDEMLSQAINEKQTTMELDNSTDINDSGVMYPPSQFLPPSLVPSIQFLLPPDSMFSPYFQPPPDSMFNMDFQPPPASIFNMPPLQTPPDSSNPFHPSPPSQIPQFFTPPPPVLPSLPFPPIDPQPDMIQSIPPPPSMLSPVNPQPYLTQSPPPSVMFPPVNTQPDLIQSAPPPPVMPSPTLLPAFPFQPSPGLPRMPPVSSFAHIKKTLAP